MPTDLGPLKEALQQYLCDAMDAGINDEMIPAMRDAAQERTGAMKAGIHADPATSDGQVVHTTIYSDEPYSSFMDQGTQEHDIFGNPLLAFYWQQVGKVVIVRSVHHPGTVGSGFFEDTINDQQFPAMQYGLGVAVLP